MSTAGLDEHVTATAAEVDAGTADTRPALAWLGRQGVLGAELPAAVALVREVSAASLATGFSLWSQTMVLEYLRCCPTPVGNPLRDVLRTGEVTGATALASAIADLAGGDPVPVHAVPDTDGDGAGWRLTGRIPWASNLFDGGVLVTPARSDDGTRIVAVLRLPEGAVQLEGPLLALNGTGTGAVQLDDVPVPADAVLSTDLAGFVGLCLPAILLTQTAMAVGVADAALSSAGSPDPELEGRSRDVADRLTALAAAPDHGDRPTFAQLRLDAMALAADAVRLEGTTRLGSGFRAGSPTSRRIREVAFLPVQAPTVAQLRAQAG